jgi:hypothetical protein
MRSLLGLFKPLRRDPGRARASASVIGWEAPLDRFWPFGGAFDSVPRRSRDRAMFVLRISFRVTHSRTDLGSRKSHPCRIQRHNVGTLLPMRREHSVISTLLYGMRQSGGLASLHVAFFIDFRYTKSAICMPPSPQAIFDQGRSFCHRRHGCHWRR